MESCYHHLKLKGESKMNVKLLSIDIAKNVFQLHGVDSHGKAVLQRKIRRKELLNFIANFPVCKIVMEACGGANYWARQFKLLGHEVKLISPQYVKPFVTSNKNDRNDAKAIAEAASRAEMKYVSVRSIEQQDIQNIHSVRQRLIAERTALGNQIRGILGEYGVCIAQGTSHLKKVLPEILEDAENELTEKTRELIDDLREEFLSLEARILKYDKQIGSCFDSHEACQRIGEIEGVGVVTATALIARVGDPHAFSNGRHFSAFLGLVPKQHSSGGKQRLLGISKRGDTYVRTLLIHGARSALLAAKRKADKRSLWLRRLEERRGMNRACVALANKNARVIWALLAHKETYRKEL
jgi:transposase